MTEKNPEVLACNASIMKNVWEIRLREYGQKMNSEKDRLERSALERINEDWAKRMSGKVKPRRVERKDKPLEELPSQTYKAKQVALGRPNGFVSNRPLKPVDVKKNMTKRNNLTLLLKLNEKQPSLMVWTKSWKFSQPMPQPEEMPPASGWGQSWKSLNIQPNLEGKSWIEHEHNTNNNVTYNGVLFPWEKFGKSLYSENFEEVTPIIDWEKSWKYTKQRKEAHEGGKNGPKNSRQEKLKTLYQSHSYNEEKSSSEWNDSWKSGKPPKEEHIKFISELVSKEGNDMETEEQSTMPWGHSWKVFKKPLHIKSKSTRTCTPPDWMDSWRVSKPVTQISQQEKISNVHEPQINMPDEPLDPTSYQTIMDASKEEKYNLLWSSQLKGKDVALPVTEWQKSWISLKNLSEYKEQQLMKKNENSRPAKIKQGVLFEVFSYPRKHKPTKILELSEHKDQETFISKWKDSWKSLKNQRRQDRIWSNLQRPRPQTQPVTPQPSLIEWANSWRFTNLNANQDNNFWQQSWSTYTRNRPDRWVRENEALNAGVPHNGPTGTRGWDESWRSTRHQHHVEREATDTTHLATQPEDTQIHRRVRSLADWEDSWQFSTNQFHHDRPSTTEWVDSWRFCSFHRENWSECQPESNQYERALEIKARKKLPCPSYRFSRSFESQTFKERFPPQEWKNSWKVKRFDGKEQPRSGLSHLKKKEFPQPWDDSWMFSATQFYKSEHTESSSIQGHSVSRSAQYKSISEWGRLWKIANPQPPKNIALWSEAKPNPCYPQQMVFWSRYKCNNYLLSPPAKDYASLKQWGRAWRFMKLESKLDTKSIISQSNHEDYSVIMRRIVKAKKHMYSHKEAPQFKRWTDACKLAKTQPRPKRDMRHKPSQGINEGDKVMFTEWAESWRFVTDSVSTEPAKTSVCLTDWGDSWKFLLNDYAQQNGPKKTKGCS
ncbi:uncharacterized protein LOC108435132 [Pygocentrus nattereri]|uniref:uncharacterized protein LOC108435132 n=1 Tax=Pygocentrus nattereri TaxID=42514 RepID=UPI00081480C5|nr:uncharacterized protein LOC108435132 [Pygocentrus nattereri]